MVIVEDGGKLRVEDLPEYKDSGEMPHDDPFLLLIGLLFRGSGIRLYKERERSPGRAFPLIIIPERKGPGRVPRGGRYDAPFPDSFCSASRLLAWR